jgi:hypothetical protein
VGEKKEERNEEERGSGRVVLAEWARWAKRKTLAYFIV